MAKTKYSLPDTPETEAFLKYTKSSLVRQEIAEWAVRGFTGKVRGVFPQKRSNPINHTTTIETAMRIYRHKPIVGNDAPRGGMAGWFAESGGEDVSWWVARLSRNAADLD